jgi:hypothetical protein
MNAEYAKLALVLSTMTLTCVVAVLKPESLQVIERIANSVISGTLGAVGGSLVTTIAAQKKEEDKKD